MKLLRRIMRVCIALLLAAACAFMLTRGIIEMAKSLPIPVVLAVVIVGVITAAIVYALHHGVHLENIVHLGTGIRGAPSVLKHGTNAMADVSELVTGGIANLGGGPMIGAAPKLAA